MFIDNYMYITHDPIGLKEVFCLFFEDLLNLCLECGAQPFEKNKLTV